MNKDRSMPTDTQWERPLPLLPGQAQSPGTTARDTRLFVETVLWRARCGMSWRDLPAERSGPWPIVYAWFRRWRQAGVWPRVLAPGAKRDGLAPAHGRLDGRTCAPIGGRREKKDSPVGQALGRSRGRTRQGGFTTKPYLSCDAHSRICGLALTRGQAGDCPQAPELLLSHLRTGQAVLADRAYDADYVRVQIAQAGAGAVIPGKKNRVVPVEHDAKIYKERNQVERAINGLKRFRAVATRLDKRAANYFAICCLITALTGLLL